VFIMADFDDTIFARKEQLEKEKVLRENRWDKWTKIMKEVLWCDYMVENYYKNKSFPKKIINKIEENDWLILTAWDKELQEFKINACNLDNFNLLVVQKAEQKPEELIKYIKNNLDYTPDLIEIYEDRPNYFIENKERIEKELNTKLDIYFVEMDWNDWYKKIELVK
jgi:hypothetical protein